MAQQRDNDRIGLSRRWRFSGWGLAALLLLLPLAAMQLTDEMAWSAGDFLLVGIIALVVGGGVELAARTTGNIFYRAGAGVAVAAGFLLVLVNLSVGFLGSERNEANLMFAGVILVAAGGSVVAHFRSSGMARAMVATAIAQLLVGAAGLGAGLGSAGFGGVYEVVVGTSLFGGLWLASAWLFRKAAKQAAGVSPHLE